MHCYVNGGKATEMSFENFECCMKKLIPMFERLGEKIGFTLDNEIYNHQDAEKVLGFVEKNCAQNYYHHGSTTGIAILNHPKREEILQILKRNHWMDVSFAIHGGTETHNKIVHNNEGMSSIMEASKLFKENGFEVWISLMISKEMVEDLSLLADILDKIPYSHLLPVIPDYYPTNRLMKYQEIRCTVEEYASVMEFLKGYEVDTKSIQEAVVEYNEEYVFQSLMNNQEAMVEQIKKQLYENETAFFHVDQKLDSYVGNTGSALKCCGNLRECSSEELLDWILSAEDNYYETASIHYGDIIDAVRDGKIRCSKENYVYPSLISAVIAMVQNYRIDEA